MPTRLVQVVPRLPPNVSGVGDYAVVLGRRVVEHTDGRIEPAYVQASFKTDEQPPGADLDATADVSGQMSASALVEAIGTLARGGKGAVLLHFVGYGYQQRGCPLWLVRALRQLERERPQLRRLAMAHEIYATSYKPWESSFWTMPVQRHVAVQVTRRSEGLMTNRQGFATWLRKHAAETPVHFTPTFSNVGEPEDLPVYGEREPYAVAFGSGSRRARLYRNYGAALSRALKRIGVERIVDIGTSLPDGAARDVTLPMERKGLLPAEEVSTYLRRASVGALRYSLHCITKSGILAAYAAHALPPLVAGGGEPNNMLQAGKHYLALEDVGVGQYRPAQVSKDIHALYRRRFSSERAARHVVDLMNCIQ